MGINNQYSIVFLNIVITITLLNNDINWFSTYQVCKTKTEIVNIIIIHDITLMTYHTYTQLSYNNGPYIFIYLDENILNYLRVAIKNLKKP